MASKLKALWNHPAGLKTVFFWAPTMKWGLVLAGVRDFTRPVDLVSTPQCFALACTGVVWTRWSFVIHPINYNLALVNVFVAASNMYQLLRKYRAMREKSQTLAIQPSEPKVAALSEVSTITKT